MHFSFSSLRPLLVSGLALAVLAGCESESGAPNAADAAPVEVGVVTLKSSPLTLTTELPGRTVAYRRAEIRPQVAGIIAERLFKEGDEVQAGDPLYQVEPATYRAQEATAQANLLKAKANLKAVKVREQRFKGLVAEGAVSQQQYDDAEAALAQAEAEVAVSEAAQETAQINLRYARIEAPISGIIGSSTVTEGALVTAQQAAALAVIHQLDPIYVDLSQASGRLLGLRRQLLSGDLSQQDTLEVQLVLEDGSRYEHPGELQFSEISVSESTGTVVMRALVPNPDRLLLPGMFVRAEISEGVKAEALLAPQRGITHDREGRAIAMVVNSEDQVELRSLTTERAVGNAWLVSQGLSSGDRLIVEGLQKIAPGTMVAAVELESTPAEAEE